MDNQLQRRNEILNVNNNNQDWLNKVPWYNTDICSRLHVSLFEDFITHAITNRYIIMCYLVAND